MLSGPKGAPGAKKATKPPRNVWFNSTLSEGAPPGPFWAIVAIFTIMGGIWWKWPEMVEFR